MMQLQVDETALSVWRVSDRDVLLSPTNDLSDDVIWYMSWMIYRSGDSDLILVQVFVWCVDLLMLLDRLLSRRLRW